VLRLVALDMDGTLVDVESSFAVVYDHFGDHNDEGLAAFEAGEIDDHEFIRRDVAKWHRHAPQLTIDELERILSTAPLMPGAKVLIDGLRRKGVRTAIISGGIDLLAHRVARELGIDIALANGFRVDAAGHLTGEGIVRVPVYEKERVLRELQGQLGVAPEETAAVGNSDIDVGMFRRSRMGVAFLPADETVRRHATHVVTEKDMAKVLSAIDTFPAA
jgi:phosphoserine phosphatase